MRENQESSPLFSSSLLERITIITILVPDLSICLEPKPVRNRSVLLHLLCELCFNLESLLRRLLVRKTMPTTKQQQQQQQQRELVRKNEIGALLCIYL